MLFVVRIKSPATSPVILNFGVTTPVVVVISISITVEPYGVEINFVFEIAVKPAPSSTPVTVIVRLYKIEKGFRVILYS